jgi:hypothetical protein
MPDSKYEKYAVRKPLYEVNKNIKNRQSPAMTLMSRKQVSEANHYIELGWIKGIPDPNPYTHEHKIGYDKVMLYWGGNPDVPQDLGGEIEIHIGGQPITINTTCGIFIPKGTSHGPITWKKFRFPHIEMAMIMDSGEYPDIQDINKASNTLPQKTKKFDYEQYVVRSPMRESGDFFMSGRQSPTMTYMSSTQINAARCYIEFGWIWDIPKPDIDPMVHRKYNEIVLHVGGDPDNPEDLGADMEFGLGNDLLSFNTTYGMYIPRELVHGPLLWTDVRRPHIEMAIMLECGTLKDGWGDSKIIKQKPENPK